MILVNETYQEYTPESTEIGEYSDQGFTKECEEYGFRELISYLETKVFYILSDSMEIREHTSISSDFEIMDYTTETERSQTLHFVGPAKNVKYWVKALNYVTKKDWKNESRNL